MRCRKGWLGVDAEFKQSHFLSFAQKEKESEGGTLSWSVDSVTISPDDTDYVPTLACSLAKKSPRFLCRFTLTSVLFRANVSPDVYLFPFAKSGENF